MVVPLTMATGCPRISFGIIVLNGQPFTRYCLRSLYPFAHEIIVVEGAVRSAAAISTPEGHSTDGTLEVLQAFKNEEDPEDKVVIVTRNGFWDEKDEMSRAYADVATGDYLWQVDIDEFYKAEDIERVTAMLREDPSISAISFQQIQLWGGFLHWVDSWYLRMGAEEVHRVFRWGSGHRYVTHRPPTVLDKVGRDTRTLHWVDAKDTAGLGIFMYHYSLVFPKLVRDKCDYYRRADWAQKHEALEWASRSFMRLERPFRVHNVYEFPSWLERFSLRHPAEIDALHADVTSGRVSLDLRPTDDIEEMLRSTRYRAVRALLKFIAPTKVDLSSAWGRLRFRFYRLLGDPCGVLRSVVRKMMGHGGGQT